MLSSGPGFLLSQRDLSSPFSVCYVMSVHSYTSRLYRNTRKNAVRIFYKPGKQRQSTDNTHKKKEKKKITTFRYFIFKIHDKELVRRCVALSLKSQHIFAKSNVGSEHSSAVKVLLSFLLSTVLAGGSSS